MSVDAYYARLVRVLRHIDAHRQDALDLDLLSRVAGFSKFHFHRQFTAAFGLTVHRYVQLSRLERASQQLAYREALGVLQIALEAGYESHEAFARAFKKAVGQAPSEFRSCPDWENWESVFRPLLDLRSEHMSKSAQEVAVSIVHVPRMPVALLVHRGPQHTLGASIRDFIAFRKERGLSPQVSRTFNLLYDDPATTAPADYRFGLAVGTSRAVDENPYGVVASEIPEGRCAVIHHVGPDASLFRAVHFLFATWLPASGEELRDYPIFLERKVFGPEVPEHEAESDIFLPLR